MQLMLRSDWTPFGIQQEFLNIAGFRARVWNRGDVWGWEVEIQASSGGIVGEGPADSKDEAKDDAETCIRKHLAPQVVTR